MKLGGDYCIFYDYMSATYTSSGFLLVIAEPHTILYRAWQVKKQTFMYKLFKKVKHFIQKHTVINTNL